MTFPLNYKVYPVLSAAQISMKSALAFTENVQAVFTDETKSLDWLKSSVKNNFASLILFYIVQSSSTLYDVFQLLKYFL